MMELPPWGLPTLPLYYGPCLAQVRTRSEDESQTLYLGNWVMA